MNALPTLATLALSTLVGCAPASAPAPPLRVAAAPETGQRSPPVGDPRVGTFVSTPWTFTTSSYWIEGPTGLILVDLQFTPSQAERFIDLAEKETGKKAVLAVVLHANPDKFNGTEAAQRRGIRVVTSEEVRALVPGVFRQRTISFKGRYAPDWPETTPAPDSFGSGDTVLEAGGTKVVAHVLGAGCSEAHVVLEWEGHVFPGDLVASGNHSWLELGKAEEWLSRLREIDAMKPRYLHPGRGPNGGPELLASEDAYLRDVMRFIDEERPVLPPPEGALERVASRVTEAYPDYGFPVFLKIGLPAEWERRAHLVK